MPDENDLRKFKMGLLGYDPTQDMDKLAQEKVKQQTQPLSQQPQFTEPQVAEEPDNNTGMPNLDLDASRANFFVNLKKLLTRG